MLVLKAKIDDELSHLGEAPSKHMFVTRVASICEGNKDEKLEVSWKFEILSFRMLGKLFADLRPQLGIDVE